MKRFCSEMMVWIMVVVGMLMDGDGVRDDKQKNKAQKKDSGVDQKEKEENVMECMDEILISSSEGGFVHCCFLEQITKT